MKYPAPASLEGAAPPFGMKIGRFLDLAKFLRIDFCPKGGAAPSRDAGAGYFIKELL